MSRRKYVEIDLSCVTTHIELHSLLMNALDFPEWYGKNWDAFWDAITALVDMPIHLRFLGWKSFAENFPRDAELMRECFLDMAEKYPGLASDVEYS